MQKRLVPYVNSRFTHIDAVRLRRTASELKKQLLAKIPVANDKYGFYAKTLPYLDAALSDGIAHPLDDDDAVFIPGNYSHDEREGTLPPEFDAELTEAIASFSVTARALPLEKTEEVMKDGVACRWQYIEEEGDWPIDARYP